MLTEIQQKNIDCQIDCFQIEACERIKDKYDIILLMPQVRYNLKKIQKTVSPTPVYVLDSKLFKNCDGRGTIEYILKICHI